MTIQWKIRYTVLIALCSLGTILYWFREVHLGLSVLMTAYTVGLLVHAHNQWGQRRAIVMNNNVVTDSYIATGDEQSTPTEEAGQ